MCLIIQTNKPNNLDKDLLECAYENNSDGFGVMFYNNGKIHTHKIVPKDFSDVEKVWENYKNLKIPMGLHFRFNTIGDTNRSLSHPFQVLSLKENGRDLWLMHNGASLPTPIIDQTKSDTHQFIKWVLKPQLVNNPSLLYNEEWQEMMAGLIGTDKLLFLDGKTKEFTIINSDCGEQVKGIGWLSNTYSIKRSVGFNYDVNNRRKALTQTPSWQTAYGNYGNYENYLEYEDDAYWDYDTDKPKRQIDLAQPDDKSEVQALCDGNFVGASAEEIVETCEDYPQEVAEWIYDLVYATDTITDKTSYNTV